MPRRFAAPKLVVATHNRGKAEEIRTMLSPFGVEIVSMADLGLPAPPETGTTFESNATIKALAATRASRLPALADDSGLSVRALNTMSTYAKERPPIQPTNPTVWSASATIISSRVFKVDLHDGGFESTLPILDIHGRNSVGGTSTSSAERTTPSSNGWEPSGPEQAPLPAVTSFLRKEGMTGKGSYSGRA